jgi:hypothetical protein
LVCQHAPPLVAGKSYLTPLALGTSRRVPSSFRCNPNGQAHLELIFCFFFFFFLFLFLLLFCFSFISNKTQILNNFQFEQILNGTDFKWNKISNSKQNLNLEHILNGTYFKWNRFKFEQISN